jgi:hypothetical protein
MAVDERAVAAAEILDDQLAARAQQRVAARNTWVIEL